MCFLDDISITLGIVGDQNTHMPELLTCAFRRRDDRVDRLCAPERAGGNAPHENINIVPAVRHPQHIYESAVPQAVMRFGIAETPVGDGRNSTPLHFGSRGELLFFEVTHSS